MTRLLYALLGAALGSVALVVWAEWGEAKDWWRDHIKTVKGYV